MNENQTPVKVNKRHIREEWNEGHPDHGGDGYWITLNAGWKWAGDRVAAVHCIHESTKTKAHAEAVLPCDCADCVS